MVNIFKTYKNLEKFSSSNGLVEIPEILRGHWENYDVLFSSGEGNYISSRSLLGEEYKRSDNKLVISNSIIKQCPIPLEELASNFGGELPSEDILEMEEQGFLSIDYIIDGRMHNFGGIPTIEGVPGIRYSGSVSNNSINFQVISEDVEMEDVIPRQIYLFDYNGTQYLASKLGVDTQMGDMITLYNKISDSTQLVCTDVTIPTTAAPTTAAPNNAPNNAPFNNYNDIIIGVVVACMILIAFFMIRKKKQNKI